MTRTQIDNAFEKLIMQRAIHNKLDLTSERVRDLRYCLKHGRPVTTDLKLELLRKAGINLEEKTFNRKDLVALLNFYKRTSQAARDKGPEYVIEKWEESR